MASIKTLRRQNRKWKSFVMKIFVFGDMQLYFIEKTSPEVGFNFPVSKQKLNLGSYLKFWKPFFWRATPNPINFSQLSPQKYGFQFKLSWLCLHFWLKDLWSYLSDSWLYSAPIFNKSTTQMVVVYFGHYLKYMYTYRCREKDVSSLWCMVYDPVFVHLRKWYIINTQT